VKNVLLVILIACVIVLAVLLVKSRGLAGGGAGGGGGAAGARKNNLVDIDCNLHLGIGPTKIVTNSTDGIKYPDDEGVFVCPGEKVRWDAGTGVTRADISFSVQEWPFVDTYQANLTAVPGTPTMELTVKSLPAGYRLKAYKYTIDVTTPAGKLPPLDPHVIPIGP
jgi:hypothetical protein